MKYPQGFYLVDGQPDMALGTAATQAQGAVRARSFIISILPLVYVVRALPCTLVGFGGRAEGRKGGGAAGDPGVPQQG